ncbi:ion channel [Tsukamurella paurometabola]|uniref:Ion channel n=1 Tax=Tsukamurella paurometabola TaxID=2061 RepID=A0A3P8KKV4_TSUPA|nr:potassium channel family protein [Tsukamurella paurometabola]MBS4101411.1 two pore domain potassium channel family protein [Tsukamurella paurometabola]UEA84113.1 two pore domain potassium channel family protein [Tsukamurella paurometabola]VDR41278.1 Ion channel [Tsukamurella paurometabola]
MLGLTLMFKRLAGAIRTSWRDPSMRGAVLSLVMIVTAATVFYTLTEKWSVIDSLFYAVSVGLPMGNGPLSPTLTLSKIFTLVYAVLVVGLFVTVGGSLASSLVQNNTERISRLAEKRARDEER